MDKQHSFPTLISFHVHHYESHNTHFVSIFGNECCLSLFGIECVPHICVHTVLFGNECVWFPNKTHFLFFQSLSPVIRTHLYTTHPHISTYWVHICVFLKKKNAYVYIHKYVVCTPLYTTRLHLSMYKCMNMYAVRTFENITQTRITCVFAQPVACNTNTFEHIWTHLNTFEYIWTHLNTFEHNSSIFEYV